VHCPHLHSNTKLFVAPLKVFYFGQGARRLWGSLHAPQRLRPRSAAVLLCNPFGEEAARAHRIYRVLATQLERSGYPVLRFDYGGTGDSSGDAHDATIASWIADIDRAADELVGASGVKKVVLVGLRLGATLAALASVRGARRPRHLILWDPVVEGSGYLRELADMHRSYMRSEVGEDAFVDRLRVSRDGAPAEALGTPIGDALAAELRAIDLATVEPAGGGGELGADHVTVIATGDNPALARLRARLSGSRTAKWIDAPTSAAWNSDAALNASVVPMDIVQTVLTRIEELSP
jgi:uncharacterized protein